MALTETGRVMAYKRVTNPDDPSAYIDVPCILQITLRDQDDGQEYTHVFDNTANNQARKTHTVTVKKANPDGTYDDNNSVDVERIDNYQVSEDYSGWGIEPDLNNNDPAPLPPPSFPDYDPATGHKKTHVVRYNQSNTNDPTATPWVDVELIDELYFASGYWPVRDINLTPPDTLPPGASDSAQETTLVLGNDPGTAFDNPDPEDPFEVTWSDNTYWEGQMQGDPLPADGTDGNGGPVRLDPFQNIVSINWVGASIFFGAEIADDPTRVGTRFAGKTTAKSWHVIDSGMMSWRSMSFAVIKVTDPVTGNITSQPVNLLGGGNVNTAAIEWSKDCSKWNGGTASTLYYGRGFGFTSLVWDPTSAQFYGLLDGSLSDDPDLFYEASIWASADGKSWSKIADFSAFSDADVTPMQANAVEAFKAFCTKPENRGGIPDGYQGYDSDTGIFMKPAHDLTLDVTGVGGAGQGYDVTIEGTPERDSATFQTPVFAVTRFGSDWVVLTCDCTSSDFGRPTQVYVSSDTGKTWTMVYETQVWFPSGILSGHAQESKPPPGGPSRRSSAG